MVHVVRIRIRSLAFFSKTNSRIEYPNIAPANMWTRKDLKDFKDTVRKEKDAVIKIGSGETVTVRVPTHEDGRCIFWEFATDYYDIGFGLYFEWTKAQSNNVTVHVSDSSEEEEEGEEGANRTYSQRSWSAPSIGHDSLFHSSGEEGHRERFAKHQQTAQTLPRRNRSNLST